MNDEIAPATLIQISGFLDGYWRGYVIERKGSPTSILYDSPVAIGPDRPAYGIKFEDITGPGDYVSPE